MWDRFKNFEVFIKIIEMEFEFLFIIDKIEFKI